MPIPYAPVLKSDFLCTQILVVGGLVKMAKTQSFNQLPSGWRLDSKKTPTVGLYRVCRVRLPQPSGSATTTLGLS